MSGNIKQIRDAIVRGDLAVNPESSDSQESPTAKFLTVNIGVHISEQFSPILTLYLRNLQIQSMIG